MAAAKTRFPRALIWIAPGLVLLTLPLFLLSSGMMESFQARIDANPRTGFHRWLQLATADACRSTWRPEMAAERYRKFVEANPEDERRRDALFRFAASLEEAEKTSDAVAVYQRFVREYPDGDDAAKARAAVDRLRHMKAQ